MKLLLLFSHPVKSDSLWPHGLQHTRPPCLSPSPGVFPSSCSLHQWCHPAISPSDTLFFSLNLFQHRGVFHWVVSIRWPKYWSVSFSISSSSEYSELISLKIDWFNFLAVQETFRSLLQRHSSKASILWHSAIVMVWLSQLYVITGKTIVKALCQQSNVSAFQHTV